MKIKTIQQANKNYIFVLSYDVNCFKSINKFNIEN